MLFYRPLFTILTPLNGMLSYFIHPLEKKSQFMKNVVCSINKLYLVKYYVTCNHLGKRDKVQCPKTEDADNESPKYPDLGNDLCHTVESH